MIAMSAASWFVLVSKKKSPQKRTYEVFIVAPTDHDVLETASGGVDAVLGRVPRVFGVRVSIKRIDAVSDLVEGQLASGNEGITDDVPLSLGAEEVEQLAQVMNQAGHLHPLRLGRRKRKKEKEKEKKGEDMISLERKGGKGGKGRKAESEKAAERKRAGIAHLAVLAHGFGRLKKVLDLGRIGIRIRSIDEGVKHLHEEILNKMSEKGNPESDRRFSWQARCAAQRCAGKESVSVPPWLPKRSWLPEA